MSSRITAIRNLNHPTLKFGNDFCKGPFGVMLNKQPESNTTIQFLNY